MMRILLATLFLALSWCRNDAHAEETRFGSYGYGHAELHKSGTIEKLIKKTGTNCCDGGTGGECRMTTIKFTGNGPIALLDGIWCRIGVTVFLDIPLPAGAEAVVCAGRSGRIGQCPNVYCAAANLGM